MRGSTLAFPLLLAFGCGEKTPPEAAAEAAPAQPAPEAAPEATPAPVAEPEPEPAEPPPPPAPSTNVGLQLVVTRADGSTSSGHVSLIERSTDWYGEQGWTASLDDVKLQLEGNGTEIQASWAELEKLSVAIAKVSESSDCTYDSDFAPWMYECTLRNKGTAVTTDGRSWEITDRHKWRIGFDSGDAVEFWLYKHPARQQDDKTVGLGSSGENYDLYIALQDRLREEVKTMVTGVTVSAD
jgi:hypothetical protein